MDRTTTFTLKNIADGFVRNYRGLNLYDSSTRSMFTRREIEYFAKIGEYLGYYSFFEDGKPNYDYGRSRPMDLSWWRSDNRVNKEDFLELVLHLERENLWAKDMETIDKLFCETDEDYMPSHVIGILKAETKERIKELQREVVKRNKKQKSEVLMIYEYYNKDDEICRNDMYYISSDGKEKSQRKAISYLDNSDYWAMCFEEEYEE